MVVSSLLEPEWKESSHSIIHQIYRFEFCPSLFWSGLDIVDEREYKWAVFNIQMRGRAKLVALKWRRGLYNIIVTLMKCKSFNNQFFQSFVENNVIVLAPIYLFSSRFNVLLSVHALFDNNLITKRKLNFSTLCVVLFLLFSKHLDLAMARIRYIIRVRNVNGGGRRESGSKNWIAKFNLEYLQEKLVNCHDHPFIDTICTVNFVTELSSYSLERRKTKDNN